MIRVFIGYDGKETVAYNVLQHSLVERASQPIAISPIRLSHLHSVFTRQRNALQSTEFSFSRFLAPYLCDYQGWALFMDCDVLARDDIARLWELRDDRFSVMVVKHDHQPTETTKFLGQSQTSYQKKNWSSVMLFNCTRCQALTPEYVNTATGLELHQFKWLADDKLIGELPHRWNHLVGYDPPNPEAALVHYTSGGPYFHEYSDCEFADEWFQERDRMLYAAQREPLAKSA
jgi:lipopolysaccharide biosynthesis glycosyltransferase